MFNILYNILVVLMNYEDIENKSCRLNKGHIDNMPITKNYLRIKRLFL